MKLPVTIIKFDDAASQSIIPRLKFCMFSIIPPLIEELIKRTIQKFLNFKYEKFCFLIHELKIKTR